MWKHAWIKCTLTGRQYLQHGYFQRDVVHFFGASDKVQTIEGVAVRLQGKFLLSELKKHRQDIKYVTKAQENTTCQTNNTKHQVTH